VRSYLSRNSVVPFLCPPTMASQKDHQHRVGHLDGAENRHDDSQDGCWSHARIRTHSHGVRWLLVQAFHMLWGMLESRALLALMILSNSSADCMHRDSKAIFTSQAPRLGRSSTLRLGRGWEVLRPVVPTTGMAIWA